MSGNKRHCSYRMKTAYTLLMQRCGLSIREAAALHDVGLDTVKSWSSGRNPVPAGTIKELRHLYTRIEAAAAECMIAIAASPVQPDIVELGLTVDDDNARHLGWPCVGAQEAMLGLVIARMGQFVRVVPRGNTAATSEAAARHEQRLIRPAD